MYFDTEYDEGSVSVPLQAEEKINVENFVQTIEEQINKLTPFIGELTSEQGLINKRDTEKPVNTSTEKPIITQNYNFPFPTIAFHQLIGNQSLNITRDRIVINNHHHTEGTTEEDEETTTNVTDLFETTTEDQKSIEEAKKQIKAAEKKVEEAKKEVEEEIKEIEEKIAEVEAEPVILTQGV